MEQGATRTRPAVTLPSVGQKVRVRTRQPLEVWEQLQRRGHLYAEPARIRLHYEGALHYESWEWIRRSHSWMRDRMVERLPGCRGHWPWWGWWCPEPAGRAPQEAVSECKGVIIEGGREPLN